MTNAEIEAAFQATMRSNETRAAETADLDRRLRTLEKRLYLLAEEMKTNRERRPIEVAMFRGLIAAVGVGLTSFIAAYQATGNTSEALIAAATAAAAALLIRGPGEGAVDESRAGQ